MTGEYIQNKEMDHIDNQGQVQRLAESKNRSIEQIIA